MIIDDDLLSREVLLLLAGDAGFDAASYPSGEDALESLADPAAKPPDAILVDMQMPGVSGEDLGERLRTVCGSATILLAMSGSAFEPASIPSFNAFLLKPFTMEDVIAKLDCTPVPAPQESAALEDYSGVLSRSIYDAFAQGMPREPLHQLYAMSLDDADARIETMREARTAHDADAYRRAAHSIKGGCGLVGATELAHLADAMEEFGPQTVDNVDPLEQFLSASAHLRRILDALQR